MYGEAPGEVVEAAVGDGEDGARGVLGCEIESLIAEGGAAGRGARLREVFTVG